jgi:phage terminase large subunit
MKPMGKSLPTPEGPLTFDYVPRQQFRPYHERKQRHAVQICHRRAGKTVACINELLMRAIAHPVPRKPPGRFGFVSPTYTQSKDVAWEYLKSYSRPFLSETPNESELRVDLWNGSRIRLYGADNPDSLRGLGFDGLVIDEYADVSPSLYPAVLRPRSPTERAGARLSARSRAETIFGKRMRRREAIRNSTSRCCPHPKRGSCPTRS